MKKLTVASLVNLILALPDIKAIISKAGIFPKIAAHRVSQLSSSLVYFHSILVRIGYTWTQLASRDLVQVACEERGKAINSSAHCVHLELGESCRNIRLQKPKTLYIQFQSSCKENLVVATVMTDVSFCNVVYSLDLCEFTFQYKFELQWLAVRSSWKVSISGKNNTMAENDVSSWVSAFSSYNQVPTKAISSHICSFPLFFGVNKILMLLYERCTTKR